MMKATVVSVLGHVLFFGFGFACSAPPDIRNSISSHRTGIFRPGTLNCEIPPEMVKVQYLTWDEHGSTQFENQSDSVPFRYHVELVIPQALGDKVGKVSIWRDDIKQIGITLKGQRVTLLDDDYYSFSAVIEDNGSYRADRRFSLRIDSSDTASGLFHQFDQKYDPTDTDSPVLVFQTFQSVAVACTRR